MKTDRKQRKSTARIDNEDRAGRIEKARDIIYNMNRPVDSELVEKELKQHSYVPTKVCGSILLRLVPQS